eukprot:6211744-Pleurochrysis_carterae.AAC.4
MLGTGFATIVASVASLRSSCSTYILPLVPIHPDLAFSCASFLASDANFVCAAIFPALDFSSSGHGEDGTRSAKQLQGGNTAQPLAGQCSCRLRGVRRQRLLATAISARFRTRISSKSSSLRSSRRASLSPSRQTRRKRACLARAACSSQTSSPRSCDVRCNRRVCRDCCECRDCTLHLHGWTLLSQPTLFGAVGYPAD